MPVEQLGQPIGLRSTHGRGVNRKLPKELPCFAGQPVFAAQEGKRRPPMIGELRLCRVGFRGFLRPAAKQIAASPGLTRRGFV